MSMNFTAAMIAEFLKGKVEGDPEAKVSDARAETIAKRKSDLAAELEAANKEEEAEVDWR